MEMLSGLYEQIPPSLVLFIIIQTPLLALAIIIVALTAVGASLGIRRMYVKALLKVFEYATNIKQQKIKDCEELLEDDELKSEVDKQKELIRLQRLREESFMLTPPSQSSDKNKRLSLSVSDDTTRLDECDKLNNNYLIHEKQTVTDDVHSREEEKLSNHAGDNAQARSRNIKQDFELGDIMDFVNKGVQAIIDDDVTIRFTTKELTAWNLLSRTNQQYEYISFRITMLFFAGLIVRYVFLFPVRFFLFLLACFYTFISTFLMSQIKEGPFKRWLNFYAALALNRILSRIFSAIITFHNREYRAKPGSICVANHTSPIDAIILSTDNAYSMIGQRHGGFTGLMQDAFSRASRHIWFNRNETKDRTLVAKRMREHVADKNNLPILIFPEGTCINNTSVMMFKKGCFEVDATIYPVAIKYDLRFGDAFWNSSKHTMLHYFMLMMTSWAIVVDVYYLPPMEKEESEDAATFAARVKTEIVKKGSFVDLDWDGMLKRTTPKLDRMYEQQQKYVSRLKVE